MEEPSEDGVSFSKTDRQSRVPVWADYGTIHTVFLAALDWVTDGFGFFGRTGCEETC
jgi:hypothetical protein